MIYKSKTEEEICGHLDALIRLAGLDKSELATEIFAYLMEMAADEAIHAIEESHEEGLCMDARWIFARAIMNNTATIRATGDPMVVEYEYPVRSHRLQRCSLKA